MTDSIEELPRNLRVRIERIRPDDHETFVHQPIGALGGRSVLEAFAGEDGHRVVAEYLLRLEEFCGPRPDPPLYPLEGNLVVAGKTDPSNEPPAPGLHRRSDDD